MWTPCNGQVRRVNQALWCELPHKGWGEHQTLPDTEVFKGVSSFVAEVASSLFSRGMAAGLSWLEGHFRWPSAICLDSPKVLFPSAWGLDEGFDVRTAAGPVAAISEDNFHCVVVPCFC